MDNQQSVMKRILNAIKWAWTVYRRPQVFNENMLQILTAQMKFLKEVADYNSPRITKLASIYWDKTTGEKDEIVLLSLWCGTGTNGPIERLEELAKENRELKRQLAMNLQNGKDTTQA